MATSFGQIDHPVWECDVEQSPEYENWDGTMSHTDDLAKGGGVSIDPTAIAHAAVAALSGLHHDPDGALEAFEGHFGPGSTDGLRSTMFGGSQEQPQTEGFIEDDSPGMADTVEADGPRGESSIALSGGEYIIPADVCANLGDGNSAAGSKLLDQFVAYVREMKHGSPDQPAPTGKLAITNFMKHIDGGQ